ncbi:ArsR/SmtB family transcription factor [Timonella sp. A28]|uniref:ArsR/SmtB family transcription factor n=1 Tax=Timonella sp. A28 TaxID=3442640 RepID=UPI003EB94F3E
MTTSPPPRTAEKTGCCSPLLNGTLNTDEASKIARMFKALSDPTRVRLLSIIAAQAQGESCLCDLTGPVGLAQPTVSHHMKQLVDAGFVTREQRGKWAYYTLVPETLTVLSEALNPHRLQQQDAH